MQHVQFHSKFGNNPDKAKISEKTYDLLNFLGYSKKESTDRVRVFNKISEAMRRTFIALSGYTLIKKILVGSKREGISLLRESDTDLMFVFENIVCIETKRYHPQNGTDELLVYTDNRETPPGYTLLCLHEDITTNQKFVTESVVRKNEKLYLSSTLFLEQNGKNLRTSTGWIESSSIRLPRRGPSLPETLKNAHWYDHILKLFSGEAFISKKDCTPALKFKSASAVKEWANRKRFYNWPTTKMIKHAKSIQLFLVPVGEKGSSDSDLQWRISFILIEIYLVHQFSDMQIKVLVVLRWIAQNVLKPIYEEMSSYVMKNIVFWLSETTKLKKGSILDHLKTSLAMLLKFVKKRHLPCYMLPERNLLVCLDDETQMLLAWKLESILKNEVLEACKHFVWDRHFELLNSEYLTNSEFSRYLMASIEVLSSMAIGYNKCTTALGAHLYLAKEYVKFEEGSTLMGSLFAKFVRTINVKHEVIMNSDPRSTFSLPSILIVKTMLLNLGCIVIILLLMFGFDSYVDKTPIVTKQTC
ncbi:uncharacterized protein LOC132756092 [Ruditapes philippinarum]|uniref:uncharacterized protein LOC132756092 n=1 Tax=Ruditapes philippinarum TaxID=129788 RepID=UPI00295B30FD|nr:uncharacterized protein LOC132756092 [Ruditapes philippinarum]